MKISIITVSFNSAETIEGTLSSVYSQDHSNIEHIVIDGGSSDETIKILERNKYSISKWVSEPDKGIYAAMNKGIALSSGDIIGILNSDDTYAHTGIISEVNDIFEQDAVDSLYGNLVYVDPADTSRVIRYWKAGTYSEGAFRRGWMPPHPTFFVKKSCYEQFGYYNTSFVSAADYELMLRFLHKYKISVAYLPITLVRMRAGGTSNVTFRNRLRAHWEDRLAWSENGLKPGLFTLLRKPLSKLAQYYVQEEDVVPKGIR